MAAQHTLTPAENTRLVLALNRAEITPFTRSDRDCWAGAEGLNPCVVYFTPDDQRAMLVALGVAFVPTDYVTVILDDAGVSWNFSSPVNGYAWACTVSLAVTDYGVPEQVEFWETDTQRPYGTAADQQVATLPAHFQQVYYACPEEAKPHVLAGYLAERAPASADPEKEKLRWWVRNDVRFARFNVWAEQPGGANMVSVPYYHSDPVVAVEWARRNLSDTLYREVDPASMQDAWFLTGELGKGMFQMPVGSTAVQVEPNGLSQLAPQNPKLLNRVAWMASIGSLQHEVYVQNTDGTIPVDPNYRGNESGCVAYMQGLGSMLTVVRGNPPEGTTQRQIAAAKAQEAQHA